MKIPPPADLRIYPREESYSSLLQKGKEEGLGLMVMTPIQHTSEDFVRVAQKMGIMSVIATESPVRFHGKEIHVAGYMKEIKQDTAKILAIPSENKEWWLFDQLSMLDNLGFQGMENDLFSYLFNKGILLENLSYRHIADFIFEQPSYFAIVENLFSEPPTRELFIERFLQDRRKISRINPMSAASETILTFREFSNSILTPDSESNIISLLDADRIFHDPHEFRAQIDSYKEEGFNAIDINPLMPQSWVYAILDRIGEDVMLTYGSGYQDPTGVNMNPGEIWKINPHLDSVVCNKAVRAFMKRFHLNSPH